ncbi:hypothetical protein Hanom_Chr10g00874541 [Helianthus anomalus]
MLVFDETMVNRAGLTHWSRQEGLIPSSRGSLAGSPVDDLFTTLSLLLLSYFASQANY